MCPERLFLEDTRSFRITTRMFTTILRKIYKREKKEGKKTIRKYMRCPIKNYGAKRHSHEIPRNIIIIRKFEREKL
jgi:hypothetical protein